MRLAVPDARQAAHDLDALCKEVQIFSNMHDAIFGDIDADKYEALLPQVMEIISNLPLHQIGWIPPLKFMVDAEVGQNLAEVR